VKIQLAVREQANGGGRVSLCSLFLSLTHTVSRVFDDDACSSAHNTLVRKQTAVLFFSSFLTNLEKGTELVSSIHRIGRVKSTNEGGMMMDEQ
jgi:hypothetical protein